MRRGLELTVRYGAWIKIKIKIKKKSSYLYHSKSQTIPLSLYRNLNPNLNLQRPTTPPATPFDLYPPPNSQPNRPAERDELVV